MRIPALEERHASVRSRIGLSFGCGYVTGSCPLRRRRRVDHVALESGPGE